MTIKQQGGVFGRNPTFNDVDVDGALSVDGAVSVGGALSVPNATSVFKDVTLSDGSPVLELNDSDGSDTYSRLRQSSGALLVQARSGTGNGSITFQGLSSGGVATNRLRVDVNGDIDFYKDDGVTIAMDFDASAGNLAFASGNGIDFSATAGTGTSELLDDYEEGVWSPAATGGLTVNSAAYTKVGRQVTVSADVTAIATTSGDISGLPFPNGARNGSGVVAYQTETATVTWGLIIDSSSSNMSFRLGSTQQQLTTGKRAYFTATYFV